MRRRRDGGGGGKGYHNHFTNGSGGGGEADRKKPNKIVFRRKLQRRGKTIFLRKKFWKKINVFSALMGLSSAFKANDIRIEKYGTLKESR